MLLSPYPTPGERIRVALLWLWCGLVILFLLVPILIPVPLSFNSGAFFIFPLEGLSTRWYEVVLGTQRWQSAIGNSLIVAFGTTLIATTLGTLTAIALSNEKFPGRRIVMPLLLSPLIVPVVIALGWPAPMPASSWRIPRSPAPSSSSPSAPASPASTAI